MAPPGRSPSSMRGMPARIRAWPAETLKRKASSRKRGDVSSSGRGIVPPMLLTMMSRRPNSFHAVGEGGHEIEVREVARHDDGAASRCFDLLGHGTQLVLGASGQNDVGPRLRQCHRGGGADVATHMEDRPIRSPGPPGGS